MHQTQTMQDCIYQPSLHVDLGHRHSIGLTINTLEQTPGKVLYMALWEWRKAILLEEIKDAHPVEFRDDTGVITIIEILVQVDTITELSASLSIA